MEDTLIYILALMKINRIVVCLVNFREKNMYCCKSLQDACITAAVGDKKGLVWRKLNAHSLESTINMQVSKFLSEKYLNSPGCPNRNFY